MAVLHHAHPNGNGSGNGHVPLPLSKRAFTRSLPPRMQQLELEILYPIVDFVFVPTDAVGSDQHSLRECPVAFPAPARRFAGAGTTFNFRVSEDRFRHFTPCHRVSVRQGWRGFQWLSAETQKTGFQRGRRL